MPRAILGKLLVDLADSVPYRQSTRVPVVLPIRIVGKDESGHAFEEITQTIDVSKQGIKTSIHHRLAPDAQVAISHTAVGRDCQARVVWQAHTDSAGGRPEVGVEFVEFLVPESFWALGSIPEDWLNGRLDLTVSQKLEYFWARMKNFPVSSELKAMVGSTEPPSVTTLADFARLDQGTEGIESSSSVSPPKSILDDQEKNQDTRAQSEPDPSMTSAETRWVGNAPALTESKLPHTPPEGPKPAPGTPSHADQVRRDFILGDLNQLARTLGEQADIISKGVDHALNSVRTASVDALDKLHDAQRDIESRFQKLKDEYENRLVELRDSNAGEYRLKVETPLSHLRDELQRLEAEIEKLKSDFGQQRNEAGASDRKETRAEMEASLAEFRSLLAQALNEFREAVAEEAGNQLRRGADSLRKISATEQRELALKSAALQQGSVQYVDRDLRFVNSKGDLARSWRGPTGRFMVPALLMAATTIVCGFAFFSTQPSWQLQPEPPAEFISANVDGNSQPGDESLARAYWNCAVQVIQKTYRFGVALPADPPPEFSIQPQSVIRIHSKAYLDAGRIAYWQKLRQVWGNPRIWVQSYQWNTDWVVSPLKSLGSMLRG